ncbi:uncharacterized protein wu:fi34b01 isoform X1 [Pseudorasbora parva]|uniref:uncharacterized protein wu:fi34b01 isoform X1 n=2 Tax=Pseudorasbora parva TaxID=51549 RepID=UPI00351F788B
MPDQEGFDESLAGFDPGDDVSVAELQKKMIIRGQLISSSEAALVAMSPMLRCGDDLMKLQLNGPEVAQVELRRDNGAPVSLTELPPHCGQTSHTNGGLVYATPYDGCGVVQQGGRYVMQIQWKGNSAVISCPMLSKTANETFLGPNPPAYLQILLPHSPPDAQQSSAADSMPEPSTTETEEYTATSQEMPRPQPPGYPQAFLQRFWPYYYPHYHYPGKVYPTAKPTGPITEPTVIQAPTRKLQQPFDSQIFWPYYHPHSHHGRPKPPEKPVPTSIPTTTSVVQAPTQKPQFPGYPQEFWPYYYHYASPKPPEKPVPTSIPTTTSVAQAPNQKPQFSGYPLEFWPYYYPHYHYGNPNPPEKPVSTSMPTTSVAQAPTQKPQFPGYHQEVWPYYYPYYPHGKPNPPEKPVPTAMPTTRSVSQAPIQEPQLPGYPQEFWPYYYPYYPHYHHGKPKPAEMLVPTSTPTTTSVAQAPTQKLQLLGYPQAFWPYYYPYHQHHGKPDTAIPQYKYYPKYPPYLKRLYSQYPVKPPKTPTMPPTTTTPQPCTTTAATECIPSANQPPNEQPRYYLPPSSLRSMKDPFAPQFVNLSEVAADSLP